MIVYLARTTTDVHGRQATDIAACESPATVARAKARGFKQVNAALHRALWRRKERAAFARMAWSVGGTRGRQVGGWTETIIRRAR